MEEIRTKIVESQKAIAEARKILGYECFTEEAEIRSKAIDCLCRCEKFAETADEFMKNVKASDIEEEVFLQMKYYMKSTLKMVVNF